MSHDVFISFAHASALPEARALREALEATGVHVFLDERSIPPGSEFPTDIADALLKSRLILVLMDENYFQRPWCVYEFQVAIAPYRTAATPTISELDHIIIAMPVGRSAEKVVPHLPPPLAQRSWPRSDQTVELVELITERLSTITIPIETRLEGINDEAVINLRKGGAVPQAARLGSIPSYFQELPTSQKDRFVGRVEEVWRIFHILQTNRNEGGFASCALRGAGGVGKTQLAAEYVWRYGPRYYPGGLVWINADSDESTRNDQFRGVIKTFAPNLKVTGNLVGDLEEVMRVRAAQQPILWVVDNMPEPSKDSPPRSIEYWCPVRHYVTLLCTSRHTVSGVEVMLQINELSVAAAVELLTKPEVQRAWLTDTQWETIAKWVGCLPLALHILHTSLSEGFISADEILARSQGSEPAPALDAEVEALHEEIAEDYVRGVAEAFHVSYQLLTNYPALRDAAHWLTRMSPIAIEEGSLKKLIPARLLGRLASRGWIQTASTGSGLSRQWSMHRVIASYLRSQSPDPDRELATLANWLMQVYRSDGPWSELIKYLPHTLYIFREIQVWCREYPGDGSRAVDLGKQLAVWLATHELTNEVRAQLHYGAASFLEALDSVQELVSQLRSAYHNGDVDIALGIARMLPAMPSSQQVAELCSELLQDPHAQVRQNAMVSATRLKHTGTIIVSLMDAILVDIDADELLVAPPLKTDIQDYSDGDPLWALPQSLDIEALARKGFDEQAYKALVSDLQATIADRQQLQAIDRLGLYLRIIDTPLPIRITSWGSYDPATQEYGQPGIRFQSPTHTPRPELFEPLTKIVVESTDVKPVERAVLNLSLCMSGRNALGTTAYSLLDSTDYEKVISLSNIILRQRQDFSSAYWWRGLALDELGRISEAIKDYGRVLGLSPKFADARFQRGLAFEKLGRADDALKEYDRAIQLEPKFPDPYYERARILFDKKEFERVMQDLETLTLLVPDDALPYHIKAICLLNLKDNKGAIVATTEAIERDDNNAETWYFQAYARFYNGDIKGARKDLKHAFQLNPRDPRLQELQDHIQQAGQQ